MPAKSATCFAAMRKQVNEKAVGERVVQRANVGTTFGNRKPRAQRAADFRMLRSIPLSIRLYFNDRSRRYAADIWAC